MEKGPPPKKGQLIVSCRKPTIYTNCLIWSIDTTGIHSLQLREMLSIVDYFEYDSEERTRNIVAGLYCQRKLAVGVTSYSHPEVVHFECRHRNNSLPEKGYRIFFFQSVKANVGIILKLKHFVILSFTDLHNVRCCAV